MQSYPKESFKFMENTLRVIFSIDRDYFRKNYLNPAIEQGFVALTIPDKPTSSKQQYYLTDKGKEFLKTLK